ncbi:bifunctional diguanylate cyclase/phosphodiesterase [Halomonas nitroreducens]|uniref:bifunctional diguanylate cyclase/phosphodiesterase n=1 Tax=Halomonas nitroreducens TaxID=447425 RepID=UPI001FE60090|nr:diguanylate cyclase [Halomonas nitroreducens]
MRISSDQRIVDAVGDTRPYLGKSAERLVGRPLEDVHALHVRFGEKITSLLAGGGGGQAASQAFAKGTCQLQGLADGSVVARLSGNLASARDVTDRLADRLPVMVAYVDREACFRFNNQAYVDFVGLSREALYGQPVSSVLDAASYDKIWPKFQRALAGEEVRYEEELALRDGRRIFFKVNYLPDVLDGEVLGFYAIIQDISEYRAMIQLLRDVHTGVNRTDISTRATVDMLLRDALEYLDLDIGIVSRIIGDQYIVHWAASEVAPVAPGDTFPLGATYCRLMLDEEDVFHTVAAGQDARINGHPCYQAFGLESYIGMPLRIDGRVWGTLNFSSACSRRHAFSDVEVELVRLIADAVERVITDDAAIQRIRRERDQMADRAMRDYLTGLPNRPFLEQHVDALTQVSGDSREVFSVAVLDIDHFKAVNDTYGHQAGDAVIQWLASTVSGCLREGDIVARIGGEEFVVVVRNAVAGEARRVMERIRESAGAGTIRIRDDLQLQITISVGVSEHADGETYAEVFHRADRALYEAKRHGRDRVCMA